MGVRFAVQWSKKKDGPPWAVRRGKNDAARGDENRDLFILIVDRHIVKRGGRCGLPLNFVGVDFLFRR